MRDLEYESFLAPMNSRSDIELLKAYRKPLAEIISTELPR